MKPIITRYATVEVAHVYLTGRDYMIIAKADDALVYGKNNVPNHFSTFRLTISVSEEGKFFVGTPIRSHSGVALAELIQTVVELEKELTVSNKSFRQLLADLETEVKSAAEEDVEVKRFSIVINPEEAVMTCGEDSIKYWRIDSFYTTRKRIHHWLFQEWLHIFFKMVAPIYVDAKGKWGTNSWGLVLGDCNIDAIKTIQGRAALIGVLIKPDGKNAYLVTVTKKALSHQRENATKEELDAFFGRSSK